MNIKRLLTRLTINTGCWLTMVSLSATTLAAVEPTELKPFRATYVARYDGLPLKATGTRELSSNGDGHYQLDSAATAVLVQVAETSQFELQQGRILPATYHYQRTGLGKNKTRSGKFDWQQMTYAEKEQTSVLTPGTLDKLSYQLQLRLDVASALANHTNQQQFDYVIADKTRRRHYEFQIAARESLPTPLGDLATVRLERLQDPEDKARITQLWLAIDHEFVLVKLIQKEEGKGFELNISDLQWLDAKAAASIEPANQVMQ